MTIETWSAMVGFGLPALVAVVNRETWPAWLKGIVALLSSAVAGTVTALITGQFTGTTLVTAMGVVFAASAASYKLWWKGSGISDKIEQTINIFKPKPPAQDGTPGDSRSQ